VRILFITATRIGDAVLSTGLLGHLVDRHEGARFVIACGAEAAPLFEAVPGLERVIKLTKRRFCLHWIALWAKLAPRRYDLIVDLRGSLIAWCLRASERRVFRPDASLGHRVRQLGLTLGLDPPPSPRLWTLPRHDEAAARLIPGNGPVLAVAPTANWPGKVWPAERFAELIARLTGAGGILPSARVAVFSAPHERDAARPVAQSVPADRRIDLAGGLDLLTAYACLKRCALFVGNDSGLMHLAAAAGTPTLGLFGPSKDTLYAPWGKAGSAVRTDLSYDEIVSRPGYDHRRTGTLMESLSVEKAEAAARDLWARIGASPAAASPRR
jgi:ADP-heptose:LPS heptosyltransferase